MCPEHGHAGYFWLTVEILISLVNFKFHQEQLVRSDHKVFYALMPDVLSECAILPFHWCISPPRISVIVGKGLVAGLVPGIA